MKVKLVAEASKCQEVMNAYPRPTLFFYHGILLRRQYFVPYGYVLTPDFGRQMRASYNELMC